MTRRHPQTLLFLAISVALSGAVLADEPATDTEKTLDKVIVKADPLGNDVEGLVQPATVIAGAELDRKKSNTLGETVTGIPGVTSSYFGPGVGRPVIRGQDGARVAILSNGMTNDDVSNVSQDHAVSIEPFLADQIEVIKGPTNLLYGSGAIGGIVNAADGRIATAPLDAGLSGRAETRYDNGSNGFTQLLRADLGGDGYALHADGVYRDNGDVAGPDGDIANSAVQTRTGALGGTVFGDWGYAGASLSRYLNEYGNPAEPGDAFEPGVTLNMQQTRFESKAGINDPIQGIEMVKLGYSYTDYRHTEFEGSDVGTQFFSEGHQFRAEAVHSSNDSHKGAFGIQAQKKSFEAIGAEAFIPSTSSQGAGLFIVEQFTKGRLKSEIGARFDRNQSEADGFNSRSFSLYSLSAAARYALDDNLDFTLNLDHAERSPVEEELYSDGVHAATAAYEIGDPDLVKEQANQIEVGLHVHRDRFEAKASIYRSRFKDYIYLSDTGLEFDDDGELLSIRQWRQDDTTFTGYEAELTYTIETTGINHELRVFMDSVRAEIDGGGNLPRIPASRYGAGWNWQTGKWQGGIGIIRTNSQKDTADYETPTDGYTLVNANINYVLHDGADASWEVFLQGNNLGNVEARSATSAIKDLVPMPGRAISAGIRVYF
ncbi:MAG: TonB-dependent receptor [Arenimonas sp.]